MKQRIRDFRQWLAILILPSDLTVTGTAEQKKLVDALSDALKEVGRLAEYAYSLEERLGLVPKIERKS